MKQTRNRPMSFLFFLAICILFALPNGVSAYDVNEKLSIEGTLTGIYQHADIDGEDTDDAGRGAAVMGLGVNFHPTEVDEFQLSLSFGAGNGLKCLDLFSLSPYAGDLEDDLKDINGRNRDYLLEAWYKHTFQLSEHMSLGMTGGIIDATAYIDDNAFANDETGQFMNDIFVNSTLANLPSYDLGGAVEFEIEQFTIKGVAMNSRNEADSNYNYYALQFGYAPDTSLGKGNYRIYGYTTSKKFEGHDEESCEKLQGIGFSADQELSPIVGIFARIGWQDDDVAVDHNAVYSGGVNISGALWGRESDAAGIGYACLKGADKGEIDSTSVVEAYAKFKITAFSDVTLDLQYVDDDLKTDADRDGFICGVRANAYF